ncbi:sulfatase-like hydrolase/transferase [Halorarum halophilum]|uniref:Sulfatase-like hydrolase/transferase n=1 Tax=Halorarum halophilum TaxID=2743090 RepID=A0A7D5KDG9_9EURY|nr:sulfatase-like hydrolase/transferase [Halobaculum halophilum]QLG27397.1 sulfatase-like hydrolase/transferase [Halobaculum halophilum]
MNIALVVLDTLRKDAFDEHFDWLPGRRFDNTWSPARWTVPAHASLFTGEYPREVGALESKVLGCNKSTLAEDLSQAGYMARAFSANPNISWPFKFDRGFSSFEGSWRLRPFEPNQNLFDWSSFIRENTNRGLSKYPLALWKCFISDSATLRSLQIGAAKKLEDLGYRTHTDDGATETVNYLNNLDVGEKEFLFINLMEAHEPYLPPKEFRTTSYQTGDYLKATMGKPDFNESKVKDAYNDSAKYLSHMYQSIFEILRGSFDLIITVSDHGESLGEFGAWGHVHGIYPEITHVPLTISGDIVEDGVDTRLTTLFDVHATILDAADVQGESSGNSLLAGIPDDFNSREIFIEDSGISEDRFSNSKSGVSRKTDLGRYQGSFCGVSTKDRYVYETPSGIKSHPNRSFEKAAAKGIIQNRESQIEECKDYSTNSEALSESARSQLEDLGYL